MSETTDSAAWDDFHNRVIATYPPSDTVKGLMAEGKDAEAQELYNLEITAGMMGLTVNEVRRRYPSERRQQLDGKRCVYFISSAQEPDVGDVVKIGIASNLDARLKAIQTHQPETMYVVGTLPGGVELEREIHKQFQHCRMRGEWFKVTEDLLAFMEEVL